VFDCISMYVCICTYIRPYLYTHMFVHSYYHVCEVFTRMQCVAVCCSVLQCAAVCCSVLVTHLRVHQVFNRKEMEAMAQIVRDNPRIDVISDEVCRVAMCCNVVQCVAVCCSVLQRVR